MSFVDHCIAVGVVLSCSVIAPRAVEAQDWGEASRLYSQGVHAYFAGRSSEAESYLSRALAIETEDPRLYYFRALSLMRLGRPDEARGDMMVGANLEARHPNRFTVGLSLQRVQGSNRLLLEQYRRQGRADVATNRERVSRQRYPQTFDQESQVLRQRIVIPLDQFMRPGGPQPLSAQELKERPQTLSQSGSQAPGSAGPSRSAAQSAGDNPFRDDPQERAGTPTATEPAPPQSGPGELNPEEEAASETESTPEAEEDPFSGT